MNILVVGGFLGSGKTSFILQLAHHMIDTLGISGVAILENEVGEYSVDDKLLRGSGLQVQTLFSGCVCCTLAGELPTSIKRIRSELDPEWLIMEATGMAFPGSVRDNLKWTLGMDCRICALADAKRWKRLVAAMGELVHGQLEHADVILVNKADTVDEAALREIVAAAQSIRPDAPVFPISASGEVPAAVFDAVLGREA